MEPSKYSSNIISFNENSLNSTAKINYLEVKKAAAILRAINHKLRQSIIKLLEERSNLTVTEIYVKLRVEQSVASDFYPFEVKQIGGGYQFLSKKAFHPTLAKLNGEKYTKKLSTASLETLAIIAYKQPITKGEIEQIRGVNSDYSVQKLLEKELIVISGRMEEMVGKPLIYSTSKSFMDYLGINTIDDLPKISEIKMDNQVEPTNAFEALPDTNIQMVVSVSGELLEMNQSDQNTYDTL